jgi:ABC-type sugar transport system substrate-binding protein
MRSRKKAGRGSLLTLVGTALLATLTLVLIAGCGGGSSSSSSGGSSESSSTAGSESSGGGEMSTASCMKEAAAGVKAAEVPLKLELPAEKVDFSEIEGGNVWFISATQSVPLLTEISKGFTEAAGEVGLTPHVYDGKGEVTTQNQGLEQAINEHADGIVLQGVEPAVVSANLAKATAAEIPVIDSFNTSPEDPLPSGISAHVTADFTTSGEVMAKYVLDKTECEANVEAIGSSVFKVNKDVNEGAEKVFSELCSECGFNFGNVDFTQLATSVQSVVSSAINSNPDLNFGLADADAVAPYMAQAITQTGKDIPIIGHDGVEANLEEIRQGKPQVADMVFPPSQSIGWAEIDQLGRVMTGMEPTEADQIPSQLFDKETLPAKGEELFPEYKEFQQDYLTEWGEG